MQAGKVFCLSLSRTPKLLDESLPRIFRLFRCSDRLMAADSSAPSLICVKQAPQFSPRNFHPSSSHFFFLSFIVQIKILIFFLILFMYLRIFFLLYTQKKLYNLKEWGCYNKVSLYFRGRRARTNGKAVSKWSWAAWAIEFTWFRENDL